MKLELSNYIQNNKNSDLFVENLLSKELLCTLNSEDNSDVA